MYLLVFWTHKIAIFKDDFLHISSVKSAMGRETYIDAESYLSFQVGSDGAIILNYILFHLCVFWKTLVKDFKCMTIEIIV